MITKNLVIEILRKNEIKTLGHITESHYDSIATEIMTELNRTLKPKKECLSVNSRDGKHKPIRDVEGGYCGLCGEDLY